MKVGFIGVGTMGASMASNIQKAGFDLVVNDVRREAAKPHLAAGAIWADTPRKVAEASDVVLTSLPGPPEVETVALGDQGLLAGMKAGQAYFALSTNSPTLRPEAVFGATSANQTSSSASTSSETATTVRRLAAPPCGRSPVPTSSPVWVTTPRAGLYRPNWWQRASKCTLTHRRNTPAGPSS